MFDPSNAYSGFATGDIEAAKKFYGETLGITVEEIPPGLSLKTGEKTTLIYNKPDFEPATYTILNFQVDDVDGAVDELASRGVEFERYDGMDQDEKGIARGDGPTIAWFKDPAGNILSVHENV